jgi:chromosome segregation ATPase
VNEWQNIEEQENIILQGMIEALVSFKVEVGKLQESVKRKENNERILNKDRKDELAQVNSENSSLKGMIQELTRKIDKLRVSKAKAKQMILQAKTDSQELSERFETGFT